MTIQQIKNFLTLAEELHFWKAAEKVFISQSSLSRQIQSLEKELGVTLFERDKRNVKLTDAGEFLQENWCALIREMDQIHRQAQKIEDGTTGMVSITYPGSIAFRFLPDFLKIINEQMPDLKVELTEPTDENHEKLLLDFHTDLAFSRDNILHPGIESVRLYSEHIYLVVPSNHWADKQTLISLNEMANENFIISGLHRTTFFASLLRNLFNKYGFEPKTTIESDFGGMILNLISKELGVSILPGSFRYAQTGNVRFIELDERIDLYISWRKNEHHKAIDRLVRYAVGIGKEYEKHTG